MGAIGLIVPAAAGILSWLTPISAIGRAALVVVAALFHVTRREWPNVVFNLVLGSIAGFVAYARYVAVPLS